MMDTEAGLDAWNLCSSSAPRAPTAVGSAYRARQTMPVPAAATKGIGPSEMGRRLPPVVSRKNGSHPADATTDTARTGATTTASRVITRPSSA